MMRLIHDETPAEYRYCPVCGAPMNMWGECVDARNHDDPYDSWRDA